MHEAGLVYIPLFENVGEEESEGHQARVGGSAQIRKIAKAIYRMSLVMGLEPFGVMGQKDTCRNAVGKIPGLTVFGFCYGVFHYMRS